MSDVVVRGKKNRKVGFTALFKIRKYTGVVSSRYSSMEPHRRSTVKTDKYQEKYSLNQCKQRVMSLKTLYFDDNVIKEFLV